MQRSGRGPIAGISRPQDSEEVLHKQSQTDNREHEVDDSADERQIYRNDDNGQAYQQRQRKAVTLAQYHSPDDSSDDGLGQVQTQQPGDDCNERQRQSNQRKCDQDRQNRHAHHDEESNTRCFQRINTGTYRHRTITGHQP